ncbi:MAG: aminotransferase class III-fold pyridoxal phosphate-dependent enzyme, partial [Gemmatimonadetes bacterium]|nr:aminotransferase class III-fold pyridoxal phosphate-dependent enzyme [Candidatus Kutchimonas denitrificans]
MLEEMIRKNIPRKARNRGNRLKRELKALGKEFGFTDIRGKGLLVAVDLAQEQAPKVVEKALEYGLLLNAPRANTLRFMPALT